MQDILLYKFRIIETFFFINLLTNICVVVIQNRVQQGALFLARTIVALSWVWNLWGAQRRINLNENEMNMRECVRVKTKIESKNCKAKPQQFAAWKFEWLHVQITPCCTLFCITTESSANFTFLWESCGNELTDSIGERPILTGFGVYLSGFASG